MALSPQQRSALIAAEGRLTADVRARLVEYAVRLWGSLGSWRDADVNRFVETLVPRVLAGQRTVASLTDSYLAQLSGDSPAGQIKVEDIRGVPDEDVYRRPAIAMYTALSQGKTFDDAQQASRTRLGSLVATGLQMTQVRQARHTMASASGIEAFRRVLRGRGDCALCIVASTQRYWKRNLLPIHPGCDCGVESLGRGEHVEQVLDDEQLEIIHARVRELTGSSDRGARMPDYRKLIVTRDHGEIGPLLAWKNQHFTGPDDLP